MKNFNRLFFALLALTSITVYAMDTITPAGIARFTQLYEKLQAKQSHTSQPYSLGSVQHEKARQDFYMGKTIVGAIYYNDTKTDGIVTRDISSVHITPENLHGKGIGSHYMRQFINQSEREGVNQLTLYSVSKAVPFYERLGFTRIASGDRHMIKKLNDYTDVILKKIATLNVREILAQMLRT